MLSKWVIVAAMLAPALVRGDSMRCGRWIVNEKSTREEILEKCGEPDNRNSHQEDVLGKNVNGYAVKLGVTQIEQWIYKQSPGAFAMEVRIVDGRVTKVERVTNARN